MYSVGRSTYRDIDLLADLVSVFFSGLCLMFLAGPLLSVVSVLSHSGRCPRYYQRWSALQSETEFATISVLFVVKILALYSNR